MSESRNESQAEVMRHLLDTLGQEYLLFDRVENRCILSAEIAELWDLKRTLATSEVIRHLTPESAELLTRSLDRRGTAEEALKEWDVKLVSAEKPHNPILFTIRPVDAYLNLMLATRKNTEDYREEASSAVMGEREIFENVSQGLTITDREGRFIYCNQPYAEMMEAEPMDLVGRSPLEFIGEEQLKDLAFQKQVRKSGKTTQYEYRLTTLKGSTKKVMVTGVPMYRDGKYDGSISVISDVEKLQGIQQQLAHRDQVLDGVSKALNSLLHGDKLEIAINNALAEIGEASGVDRVYIFQNEAIENGELAISQTYEWCQPGVEPQLENPELQQVPYFPYFEGWYNKLSVGEPYGGIVSRLPIAAEREILESQGILSIMVLPIFSEGEFWGFVGFDECKTEREWSPNEISVLMALAAGIGSTISRSQAKHLLMEQKDFYENVLNSIPSDIVVFDAEHRYKFLNPMAVADEDLRRWMIDRDDFDYVRHRGKPVAIAEDRRKRFNEVKEAGTTHIWEERLTKPDGSDLWVLRHLKPVYDASDQLKMMIGYGLDITELKKSEAQIEFLARFPEQNPLPVLRVDGDGQFLYVNEPGKKVQRWLEENDPDYYRKLYRTILDSDEIWHKELKIGDRYYLFTFAPVPDMAYINIYSSDITAKVLQEKELVKAKEQAEESKRLKQRFLANMSHEIRTPLNGMNGIIHLLKHSQLSTAQRDHLAMLDGSSKHLLRLIEDILDYSKIDENKLEMEERRFNMNAIISEVLQNAYNSAEDKEIEVRTEGLEIFDRELVGDPVRIRQILFNLVSNAVKFTDEGSVTLKAQALKQSDSKLGFQLSVIDTGIGIRKESLPIIFDSFRQESKKTDKLYGGTGLGLSIVKELINYMDGQIEVESQPAQGSTFTITLTLPFADEVRNQPAEHAVANQQRLASGRILVVDDHEVNRVVLKQILEEWNVEVEIAVHGQQAIDMLETEPFDLVLMDIQMPIMNGQDAAIHIRSSQKPYSQIPIIAMTAAAMPEERDRCLNSGMNDYVSKPFDPDHLFHLIEKMLFSDQGTPAPKLKHENKTTAGFDLSYLEQIADGNREFIQEMIGMFLTDIPQFLKQMEQHLETKDFDAVGRIAHKAKSMAGYVKAEALRECFLRIEKICTAEGEIDPQSLHTEIEKAKKLNETISPSLQNLLEG